MSLASLNRLTHGKPAGEIDTPQDLVTARTGRGAGIARRDVAVPPGGGLCARREHRVVVHDHDVTLDIVVCAHDGCPCRGDNRQRHLPERRCSSPQHRPRGSAMGRTASRARFGALRHDDGSGRTRLNCLAPGDHALLTSRKKQVPASAQTVQRLLAIPSRRPRNPSAMPCIDICPTLSPASHVRRRNVGGTLERGARQGRPVLRRPTVGCQSTSRPLP